MISFRTLIVTIVSIFLALGLGVLAGTTVLDQQIVKNLEERTTKAEQKRDQYQNQRDDLTAFVDALIPHIVEGRLAHREIVLIWDANTDGGAVSSARDLLTDAGAKIVAELRVTNQLDPEDSSSSGLARILGLSPTEDRAALVAEAARALAERLQVLVKPPDVQAGPGEPDVLDGLLSGGFLLPGSSGPNLSDVGGLGQTVVVVGGGTTQPAAPFEGFMLPLVEQLLNDGMSVAAGEPLKADYSFVGLVRSDTQIPDDQPMVTVDDLAGGSSFGSVALVLGLKELLQGDRGGDYGVKDGASDGLLPAVL